MFCQTCGKQILENERFCISCGSRIGSDQNVPASPAVSGPSAGQAYQQPQAYQQLPYPGQQGYNQQIPLNQQAAMPINRNSHESSFRMLGIGLTALLLIGASVFFVLMKTGLTGWLIGIPVIFLFGLLQLLFSKRSAIPAITLFVLPILIIGAASIYTGNFGGSVKPASASQVSKGVNLNDLGNIMNGQYFFDDGTSEFYSSFDTANAAHIYKRDKATGNTETIFNGFGWSFAVYKGWLYFSGNEGTTIDGTYTLYRIKTDGTTLEHLNSTYCYGLNFYNEFLYYIKKDSYSATNYSICRSGLDGTNEEVLVQDGNGYCIIFNNKLYYSGTDGFIYSANPDGTGKVQANTDSIYTFIIGNGKLIYLDAAKNLKISNLDGSSIKTIKAAGTMPISRINSYKNTIFYATYDEAYLSDQQAWSYHLYSIGMDGMNDVKIYDGISNGFYINVLNNKVFVLDYAYDTAQSTMPAISREMDLNGQNLVDLYR